MSTWTIRGLLNPVLSRLLIYGVHPIDVETAICAVESKTHLNAKSLERSWLAEWEQRASHYAGLAERAEQDGNLLSAGKLFTLAAQCYYAAFLVNPTGEGEKKRIYLRWAKRLGSDETNYDALHVSHTANHANFMRPQFFVTKDRQRVPYSIDHSAHLCSCCLELFKVIGEQYPAKLVAPCPGATIFARLKPDQYLLVENAPRT